MNWQGPEFVIAIIAISTIGWVMSSWIRAKHGYPVEGEWGGTATKSDPQAERKIELLTNENDKLHNKVGHLEERISVLERIVTDEAHGLTREIESLRGKPVN
jgi:hypothetical protein